MGLPTKYSVYQLSTDKRESAVELHVVLTWQQQSETTYFEPFWSGKFTANFLLKNRFTSESVNKSGGNENRKIIYSSSRDRRKPKWVLKPVLESLE